MNILVTGSSGFVGKNLTAALENIKSGKDTTRNGLKIDEIFCYDVDSADEELKYACENADFVFNFAGINRPKNISEFNEGNRDFVTHLFDNLKTAGNKCPVMLSSSIQASLTDRYKDSEYGRSKLEAENLAFEYSRETGVPVFVYRFTNLFGKWCKPNYNSVVATFCNNIARGEAITVNDRNTELELLYIDDVISAMLDALENKVIRCNYDGITPIQDENGKYCYVPESHKVTLGQISDLLYTFRDQPETLVMPEIETGSFAKKLYSTYLSYLPKEKMLFPLKMNTDERGSFTEILKTQKCGQFSVSVSKPGAVKGQHWHNSKWELFCVVSGKGLIRERNIWSDEVIEFEVSGEKIEAVHMLPGYSHSIINLSDTEDLITVMWANDCFDKAHPDTYREQV